MDTVGLIVAPVLLLLVGVLIFLVWVLPGVRAAREAAHEREHARLTVWLEQVKEPGKGPAILRDERTDRILLPPALIRGTGGRHRASRKLTSRDITG